MNAGAVVLQADGTLVDSSGAHADAWAEAFAVPGISAPFFVLDEVIRV